MGWHYAARLTKDFEGEPLYELVEVYPDLGEGAYTENPVMVSSESLEGLSEWLKIASEDVLKHKVIK